MGSPNPISGPMGARERDSQGEAEPNFHKAVSLTSEVLSLVDVLLENHEVAVALPGKNADQRLPAVIQ